MSDGPKRARRPARLLGAQRPRRFQLPAARQSSDGPAARRFAASLGYELDDWQAWVIDGILSTDAEYRLCAITAALLVSRQNGKNVILEVVELYLFYVLDWPQILHTAHRAETSADHMAHLVATIRANPELDEITTVYESNGKERIHRDDNGADIRFMTRSKKIGRGRSPRAVVFDEALYLTDEQMQAILPAMSAQSMQADKPLMIFTSSAPVPESVVLHRLIASFASNSVDGFFADWGAEWPVDITDRNVWAATNPGYNVRISEEWIADKELALLTPEAFAIERLGVVFAADSSPSELPGWGACADPESTRTGPVSIAVDVALDLSWSSIGIAATRADGRLHLEVVAVLPGTSGTAAAVAAAAAKYDAPVIVNPRSEAAGLIPEIVAAGARVHEIATLDYLRACVQLRQAVANGTVAHRDQQVLNVAVAGAAVRPVGDGWTWAPRSSATDISPLIAVTLAAWHASEEHAPTPAFALVLG